MLVQSVLVGYFNKTLFTYIYVTRVFNEYIKYNALTKIIKLWPKKFRYIETTETHLLSV